MGQSLKLIEFEIIVYIKIRTHENFDEFLQKYWLDHSLFKIESLELEFLFQKLSKQIEKNFNIDSRPRSISELSKLFEPRKTKKDVSLRKHSFMEFIQRKALEEKNNKTKEKPFLSNEIKYNNFNLSDRKFKIIDYGNCYDYSDERYGLINTRQYRAPEVILSKSKINQRLQRMV